MPALQVITYRYRGRRMSRLISADLAPLFVKSLRRSGADHIRQVVAR